LSVLTGRLGASEVQHFREHGWYLLRSQVFSPARLGGLTAICEEHVASKGAKLSDELDTPHFSDPRLLGYLLSDEVVDLVEPLVGPDIVLWSSHFIVKEPFVGRATPWHEDSAYWEGRLSSYADVVTVWLALTPSHRGNGCMSVVDRSHLEGGFSQYHDVDPGTNTFPLEVVRAPEEESIVYFELAPGEASLHDGRIVHGARPNASNQRRAGYTMRYFPADVRVVPEANPGHRLWLARGEDRAGNTYENA
jgi:hypothetical protein